MSLSPEWAVKLKAVAEALQSDWKWAARFALLIAVFVAALLPVQARLHKETAALERRQKEIEMAKKAGLNFLSAAEMRVIQQKASEFESGYIPLSQVTSVLDRISEEANRRRLRVIRVQSESPVLLRGPSGEEILIQGKKLSRLPIRIRLEANFKTLGEFVHALSKNSKQAVAVDELVMEPAPSGTDNNLRCDLTLSYFSV